MPSWKTPVPPVKNVRAAIVRTAVRGVTVAVATVTAAPAATAVVTVGRGVIVAARDVATVAPVVMVAALLRRAKAMAAVATVRPRATATMAQRRRLPPRF